MKVLKWLLIMVDVLLVLCPDIAAEDNQILSREKRTHEQDLYIGRKREKRKNLEPVVIIPVNDINTHKKVKVKVNKDYATIGTNLPAKVPNENNTSHISPLLKVINARKQLLNALIQRKNLTEIENKDKYTNNSIKEKKIEVEAKNITIDTIDENIENGGNNKTITKVEDEEKESNVDKRISEKIKERERIRRLLKKGKKSEVVTPNHYDRMYSRSKRPYLFIEKERKKKVKTPNEEIIKKKEEPINSRVVNKKYVEKLLKIEKTPSVAGLNNTDSESIEDNLEAKRIDEVTKIENVVNTPVIPTKISTEEPPIPIEIVLKTENSKEYTRQQIEPSDSIYIQKESLNELYEINDPRANYCGVTTEPSLNPEYTEICPDFNQCNQINTYDCNIPYNNAPVCNDASSYAVGPGYNNVPAYQNVPPGYENVPTNYNNQITNLPYFYQQCRPTNTGNGRLWRCWKNTNMFYMRRPGYLPTPNVPVQPNPYLSYIPNCNQPLMTPNSYMNQNSAYCYGQN